MCTLTFDWNFANENGYPKAKINDERKADFERTINEKYSNFCERINKDGGKILVGYSIDGESITYEVVDCSLELSLEIHGLKD